MPLPRFTADLPGTGGLLKQAPEDFVVEELPERAPSGRGDHLYLWVEKRGLDHAGLVRHLVDKLGLESGDIGTAGMKDAHAITRQMISVPQRCEARVGQIDNDAVRVLSVSRDEGRLRTGRLLGNRFLVCLRGVVADAEARARPILERMAQRGMPNFFGPQRFGDGGSTSTHGLGIWRGERPRGHGSFPRLALSAAQSALFNDYLTRRSEGGMLHGIIEGELIEDRRTGTPEWVVGDEGLASARQRLAAGVAVPLGPMFGPKMRGSKGKAKALEAAVLATWGITAQMLASQERLAPGTRRPTLVWPRAVDVRGDGADLRLAFELPAGAYATVLLDEVMKLDAPPSP